MADTSEPHPPPPDVVGGQCVCGASIPDGEAFAHYYHVSSPTMCVCPEDGTPLVLDFSVPRKEWRCVTCDSFFEFLGAPSAPSTHDLALRYVAALEATA